GLVVATACIVIALNGFSPVQAQAPVRQGFTSAKTAKTAQFKLPTVPTVTALDTPQQPSGERAIICKPGQPADQCDDRLPLLDRSQPWSAIGRIVMTDSRGGQYQCTGTLIADNLILTNAHCVINPDTHQAYASLFFEPNLIDGILSDPQDKTRITGGVYGTDFRDRATPPHPEDWAIATLEKPLGQKYGTIGIQAVSIDVFRSSPDKLTLLGYSYDFPNPQKFKEFPSGAGKTPGVHKQCSVVGERPDSVLVHYCDMRGGASGGPIIAWVGSKPYIVAINSAERVNQETGLGPENYATNVARVIAWVQKQGKSQR
ncbi:MAG: trypsin-like serine peptidase, partial [Leptodesmis sp.]|uniref:trypsin-like serine peptidase n=1 Tax=Leptodesmis sp. TaxID=3100501 RepID=UPI003D0A0E8B